MKPQITLFKHCKKTGKRVGVNWQCPGVRWLFPILGILSIVWFLIRVIPKPSRAVYPCQRVAASIGGSFLLYLTGVVASLSIYRLLYQHRGKAVATAFIILCSVMGVYSLHTINAAEKFTQVFTAPEGVNAPMGTARGLFPGRVVWTQDFDAAKWDGKNGQWWEDANTDQAAVKAMFSKTIQSLTATTDDRQAWQSLFRYQNQTNGRGEKGYQKGEKIVIKINCNAVTKIDSEWKNQGYPSPHMLYALIEQLIEVAGVSGSDIIVSDPSRFITSPIYNKIRSNPSPQFQAVTFEQKKAADLPGYTTAVPDENNKISFVMADGKKTVMCLPQSFTDATYLINCSLVRPHRVFASTSVAKNHFGSVWDFDKKEFHPGVLHAFALWDYPTPNKHGQPHSNTVLLGHKTTFGKTLLYMADGLYTSLNQGGPVQRWSSMDNHWFSSLLISQDPVALESVVMDFICSEPNLTAPNPSFNGHQDNSLHESALADNPPSHVVYDPENDGSPLKSLGVHEHWNNPKDKQYSRNLGKDKGIELLPQKL
jgi:hypothetical protein